MSNQESIYSTKNLKSLNDDFRDKNRLTIQEEKEKIWKDQYKDYFKIKEIPKTKKTPKKYEFYIFEDEIIFVSNRQTIENAWNDFKVNWWYNNKNKIERHNVYETYNQ